MNSSLLKFSALTQTESSILIGGFSAAFGSNDGMDESSMNGNCKGGNCKKGCGRGTGKTKQGKKPVPNGNCGGNCVAGCGEAVRH